MFGRLSLWAIGRPDLLVGSQSLMVAKGASKEDVKTLCALIGSKARNVPVVEGVARAWICSAEIKIS